jgi:hypothetical protein
LPRVRCSLETTGGTGRRLNKHGRRRMGPWTRPTVGSVGLAEGALHSGRDRQPESPPAALPGALLTSSGTAG